MDESVSIRNIKRGEVRIMWKKFFIGLGKYVIISAGAAIFIFPFVWLVSSSLKTIDQLYILPPKLLYFPVQWKNYVIIWDYAPIFRFLLNSAYVVFMSVIGSVLSCSLVAYSFARLRWPGRDICFIILLATMMIPFPVRIVPLYLIFNKFGWIDTFKPLWIQYWFAVPFYVFLLRQFFRSIPIELEDAAKIDGCSHFTIYWRIILPLVKPALTAVAIFCFMASWNDFIGPLIFINSISKMTIALGLSFFQTTYEGEYHLMLAAATVMTIPVLVLFFLGQKYFIQGIVLSGLKR